VDIVNKEGAAARKLRKELEAYHTKADPTAVTKAWPHLASKDRYLQFAARLAIENQSPAEWQDRALQEKSPEGRSPRPSRWPASATQAAGPAARKPRKVPAREARHDAEARQAPGPASSRFIRQGQPSFVHTRSCSPSLSRRSPRRTSWSIARRRRS